MTDLISRREAIKAIDDLPNCYNGYSDTYDKAYIIGALEEVPKDGCEYWDGESGFCALHRPADLKRGKWIIERGAYAPDYMKCSCCRWITEYYDGLEEELNYCPMCGAKMESCDEVES